MSGFGNPLELTPSSPSPFYRWGHWDLQREVMCPRLTQSCNSGVWSPSAFSVGCQSSLPLRRWRILCKTVRSTKVTFPVRPGERRAMLSHHASGQTEVWGRSASPMLGTRVHPLPSSFPHAPTLVFDEIWGLPIFDVLTCWAAQSRDECGPNRGFLWLLLSLSISSQLRLHPPPLFSLPYSGFSTLWTERAF